MRIAVGQVGVVSDDAVVPAAPVAHLGTDADGVLVVVFHTCDEVAPIVGEAGAVGDRHMLVVAVAVPASAEVGLALETVELRIEDDVDDPGNCVRAVDRRGAASNRFRPLHQHRRHQGDVDAAARRCGHDSPGIHQGKRAGAEERVQTPQVDQLRTDVEISQADIVRREEVRVRG